MRPEESGERRKAPRREEAEGAGCEGPAVTTEAAAADGRLRVHLPLSSFSSEVMHPSSWPPPPGSSP